MFQICFKPNVKIESPELNLAIYPVKSYKVEMNMNHRPLIKLINGSSNTTQESKLLNSINKLTVQPQIKMFLWRTV